MVLGGDDTVSVVALAGQVDVGHLVVLVDRALHLRIKVANAAGLHLWQINYLLFNILSFYIDETRARHGEVRGYLFVDIFVKCFGSMEGW